MEHDTATPGTGPDLDEALARAIRLLISEAIESDAAPNPKPNAA